jgi:hypothetical protein
MTTLDPTMEVSPPMQASSNGPEVASTGHIAKVERDITESVLNSEDSSADNTKMANAQPSSSIFRGGSGPTRGTREQWRPSDSFERSFGFLIIAIAVLGVFLMIDGRSILFNTNTATGGDMGAHVWTGDFVWRKLLTQGRVTGWSDDWFAGFPVLGFYFPFPFWIMTALNVVLPYTIAFKIVTGLGLLMYPATGWALGHHSGMKRPLPVFMGLATFPYMVDRQWAIYGGNVGSTMAGEFSFTLSMASALLFLGLLAKVMRKGERRASAGIVLAMVGLSHLLPTIWVGVAGTFVILTHLDKRRTNLKNAYGVFLAAAVAGGAIWVLGAHRIAAVAAAVIALGAVVYDHRTKKLGLGQFGDAFAAVATGAALAMFWIWPFWHHLDYSNDMGYEKETKYLENLFPWLKDTPEPGSAIFFCAFGLGLIGAAHALWTFGKAISRSQRADPKGWHGIGLVFCALVGTAGTAAAWPYIAVARAADETNRILTTNNYLRGGTFLLVFTIALILVFAWEVDDDWNRLGVALTVVTALCAVTYRAIPFGFRLWNNRVLPFWLMGTFMLAAMGLYALGSMLLSGLRSLTGGVAVFPAARIYAMFGAVLVTHAAIALPLGMVPGFFPAPKVTKQTVTNTPASGGAPVTEDVGGWLVGLQRAKDSGDFSSSLAKGWPPYNYRGYENRGANWIDYQRIIQTMDKVGKDYGCGRAHWEYESKQDRWGTPMALMLLPYWTKSCIGSMEGLYFESSATAPYHWINAGLTSKAPSNPQRELPYKGLDLEEGVRKLQQWGVSYYMAFSPSALKLADVNPDLELLTTTKYERTCDDAEIKALTCPKVWKIYRVKGADLVEGLKLQPAVVTGIKQNQTGGWLDMAVAQYNDSATHPVPYAADGPKEWQRVAGSTARTTADPTYGKTFAIAVPNQVPLAAVKVTNITSSFTGKNPDGKPGSISFHVDKVGVPVVVKMSYFPNFRVDGAKGPYRIAPNMMVVIPTQKNVSVRYTWDGVDYQGFLAGLAGVGLAIAMWKQDKRKRTLLETASLADWRESRAAERQLLTSSDAGALLVPAIAVAPQFDPEADVPEVPLSPDIVGPDIESTGLTSDGIPVVDEVTVEAASEILDGAPASIEPGPATT